MKSVRLIKITVWSNATENNPHNSECCDVNGLILSRKRANRTLQTMRQQYLKLCTAANIPEPVNDHQRCSSMKQRLIVVWSGVQQTVVNEAIDEQKKFLGLQMDTSLRICYNVWSSTFSVNILPLNCWNFCVCQCVSMNYYGALANVLVVSGKT